MRKSSMLKKILSVTCIMSLITCAACKGEQETQGPSVKPTVNPSLFPDDVIELVDPDESKYLKVTVLEEGRDIYSPTGDWGYRYGPSIMTYTDGSIDAWFAAPATDGQWDWITYRHYDPKKDEWSNELSVLQPTGDSMDWLSCCDPGVVYFDGYYYLGYTSTIDDTLTGVRNNVYVARSKNPDGPFEKWNGTGWGGKPQPIIYYDGDASKFGAGEPSFVELKGKLYIYYTWKTSNLSGSDINQTRVAVADSTREDWPATIEYKGIAIEGSSMSQDSADIKYIEDYGKFIGVCTDNRFGDNSKLCIYESNDGLTFKRVNELRSNLVYKMHNSGISSRPNGHVNLADKVYVGYAYGEKWGCWGTRIHQIQISLTDEIDLSDSENKSIKKDVERIEKPEELWTVGITSIPHEFEYNLSHGPFNIPMFWQDTMFEKHEIKDASKLKFYGYDKNIIKIEGLKCTPLKVGETIITAEYDGRMVMIPVAIRDNSIDIGEVNPSITSLEPMKKTYTVSRKDKECLQIRAMAVYENLSWNEIYRKNSGVTYEVEDSSIAKVNSDGLIMGRKAGTTSVTVKAGSKSFTVSIVVTE